MEFDPLVDYGILDLTNKENLVYCKFSELLKTLITLSSSSERQFEIIGLGRVCYEMADDFDTFYNLAIELYSDFQLLTNFQKEKLDDLNDFFKDRIKNDSEVFFNDDLLATNSDWAIVRQKSKNILEILGKQDLEIKFDHKVTKNQKLMIQSTKIILVNK